MDKLSLRCEDEPIHLCGRIQEFGFLLVFDSDLSCTAASENVAHWLNASAQSLLGRSITSCWDNLSLPQLNLKQLYSSFEKDPLFREVSEIDIKGTPFYASLYQRGDLLYLEFEQCNPSKPNSTKLYAHARYLDAAAENLWFALCERIYHVIGFDRVMIYKFMDDGSGQVIAEKTADDIPSLLAYRYPESDIPSQARHLYSQFIARHTVDVNAPTYAIIGRDTETLDLGRSSIRALSPIHLEYLRNTAVEASGSFSILVDGQLWGLVTCQHRSPRMIDLGQRHLCVFLVQYTVNRHLAYQRNLDLQYNKRIQALELDLKEKLLVNADILTTLRDHADLLRDMAGADGLIIHHPEGTYRHGSCPDPTHFEKIQERISILSQKELAAYQQIQIDSPHGSSFPGVAKIDILKNPRLSLYWFRKAIEAEEIWAGNPEKHYRYDTSTGLNYPSPRTSFEAWKQTVHGQAPSWKKRELLFMRRMRYTVQDAVMKRMSEIQILNEKLVELNSTLDTYSHTLSHDLRNPLSAIKLAAQMIQQRNNLSEDFLKKISTNVLEAVEFMSDMIQQISEFSKSKSFDFVPRVIDADGLILKVVSDCRKTYPNKDLDFKIGTLHTFLGEKNLVQQLFTNVLLNAVKYSSKNEKPQVRIESYKEEEHVIYHITDNGIGIPAEEIDSVFDIFKRTSNALEFEGAGIGLTIAKRIAERLGAELALKSVLGRETIFILKFKATVGNPLIKSKPPIHPSLAQG